jgi:hypothetical protein
MKARSIAAKTLEKASFFLDQAETCPDLDAFGHFLEAAIVYGRSVTFHLQKEFKNCSGFDVWYSEKQEQMTKDPLFSFLLKKRNYSLKEGPVSIQKTIAITITETVSVSDFVEVYITRGKPWYRRGLRILFEDLYSPLFQKFRKWRYERELCRQRKVRNKPQEAEVREIRHFEEPEWRTRPATDLVREYLQSLAALVKEGEALFLA